MNRANTLRVTTPNDLEVVMEREFNAPRVLVWRAMTAPALIRRWMFSPPGWTMTTCEEDVRVGGSFHWAWSGPDGAQVMVMRGTYREVAPPERLVRTERFEMGCGPDMPEQVCTLTLAEHSGSGGSRTLLTLRVRFPSKEARDAMVCAGMEQGVSAGYDRLEEMLAKGEVDAR